MEVLYDLQHDIYGKPHGGSTELAINVATAALSIGLSASDGGFASNCSEIRSLAAY